MKRLLRVLTASLCVSASAAPAAEKPNLVFMIADDCTYLDMEVYDGQAKTPRLKKLAEEGMQFSRCFQAAPMCSPTRHNIYTGIYPVRSGAYPNHTCVYPGTKSIAHYLQAEGYRVALSGKTHIAPRESFPFEYLPDFNRRDPRKRNPYPALATLIRESKKNGNPFCMFACSDEPHGPYTKGDPSAYPPDSLKLPPSWVDTPKTRDQYSRYLAEITYFDAQCGALLDLLEEQGVADNTLVMVVSEQGSGFPFAKWTCYEMGLASAMIVRWPGMVAPGSKSDALVEYCDVSPTFLDAAGAAVPDTMDGQSFLPVLLGEKKEHKRYTFGLQTTRGVNYAQEDYGIRSCATKTHRYVRNLNPDATFYNIVTKPGGLWAEWSEKAAAGDAHAKAMTWRYQHRPAEELYDVVKDPHCLHDLADKPELADVKRELSEQLDKWMTSQGDKGAETEALAPTRQPKHRKPPKALDGKK